MINTSEKKTSWSGWWKSKNKDKKESFSFENFRFTADGKITGSGIDVVSPFTLSGTISNEGDVAFIQQYCGTKTFACPHKGKFSRGTITGVWSSPNNGEGEFEITSDIPYWSGWWESGGRKQQFFFTDFDFTSSGRLMGVGMDEENSLKLKGTISEGGDVVFTREYQGSSDVYYHQGTQSGGVIPGIWVNKNRNSGKFELSLNAVTWEGIFWSDRHRHDKKPTKMRMNILNDSIYGVGTDIFGSHVIYGTNDNGKIKFVKDYIGSEPATYEGILSGGKIEGSWRFGGGANGNFMIEKQ